MTTFEAIQSRHSMEGAFQSQLEEISGKLEELVGVERVTSLLVAAIPF
jgi:hypothetical protein